MAVSWGSPENGRMAAAFCRIARFDGTDTIVAYHGVKTGVSELMARSLRAGVLCFAGNPSPEELPRRTAVMEVGHVRICREKK